MEIQTGILFYPPSIPREAAGIKCYTYILALYYLNTYSILVHHIPLKLALAVRSGSVGAHNGDELTEGGSEEE